MLPSWSMESFFGNYFFSCLALFMVDAVHVIYLWHGWWPQSDEDSESRASTTGSAETRWSNDRRLAMETIKSYAEGISFSLLHSSLREAVPTPASEEQRVVFLRGWLRLQVCTLGVLSRGKAGQLKSKERGRYLIC